MRDHSEPERGSNQGKGQAPDGRDDSVVRLSLDLHRPLLGRTDWYPGFTSSCLRSSMRPIGDIARNRAMGCRKERLRSAELY